MTVSESELATGESVRLACRENRWARPTAGLAPGFAQANLVIVPKEHAFDLLLFCQRNPRPCPILEVTDPGDWVPGVLAPTADLRTDLPRYRVWEHGQLIDEPTDVMRLWRPALVSFLLGCSYTFDHVLQREGLEVRHVSQGLNVPMYRTSLRCRPAGVFQGPLVVSMRPFDVNQLDLVAEVTGRFPEFHGAPIHVGDPQEIGINRLDRPDYGNAVEVRKNEVPVFWACGVTPQCALEQSEVAFAITHSPGHMFLTDISDERLLSGGTSSWRE